MYSFCCKKNSANYEFFLLFNTYQPIISLYGSSSSKKNMFSWSWIGIVLYCIMRPYTDGPIGPLSYRHSSGVVRNPHSALAE